MSLPEIGWPQSVKSMVQKDAKKATQKVANGALDNKAKLKIREFRVFSEAFKEARVKELVSKKYKMKEICDLYSVSAQSVYGWLYKYSPDHERKPKLVVEMDSEATKTKELLARVAQLEQIIGQKQMEIDVYSKVVALASKEYGVDLKKNFGSMS